MLWYQFVNPYFYIRCFYFYRVLALSLEFPCYQLFYSRDAFELFFFLLFQNKCSKPGFYFLLCPQPLLFFFPSLLNQYSDISISSFSLIEQPEQFDLFTLLALFASALRKCSASISFTTSRCSRASSNLQAQSRVFWLRGDNLLNAQTQLLLPRVQVSGPASAGRMGSISRSPLSDSGSRYLRSHRCRCSDFCGRSTPPFLRGTKLLRSEGAKRGSSAKDESREASFSSTQLLVLQINQQQRIHCSMSPSGASPATLQQKTKILMRLVILMSPEPPNSTWYSFCLSMVQQLPDFSQNCSRKDLRWALISFFRAISFCLARSQTEVISMNRALWLRREQESSSPLRTQRWVSSLRQGSKIVVSLDLLSESNWTLGMTYLSMSSLSTFQPASQQQYFRISSLMYRLSSSWSSPQSRVFYLLITCETSIFYLSSALLFFNSSVENFMISRTQSWLSLGKDQGPTWLKTVLLLISKILWELC